MLKMSHYKKLDVALQSGQGMNVIQKLHGQLSVMIARVHKEGRVSQLPYDNLLHVCIEYFGTFVSTSL